MNSVQIIEILSIAAACAWCSIAGYRKGYSRGMHMGIMIGKADRRKE